MSHDAFVRGIATILWGLKWAEHVDGHRCEDLSGRDITEAMPEIPEVAWRYAERIAGRVEGANGCSWAVMFAAAMRAEGVSDEDIDYTGREAQRFGECAFYMSAGHGVSWYDDHAKFRLPGILDKEGPEPDFDASTDDAEMDCYLHACDTCEGEGSGVRCAACSAYYDPDRLWQGDKCGACGTVVEGDDPEPREDFCRGT